MSTTSAKTARATDPHPATHATVHESGRNGPVAHLSVPERAARGKAARAEVPRNSHGEWLAPPGRRDPVEMLEEQASRVPEPFLGKCRYANHGQQVVEGQRLMQAASDIMLGWDRIPGPGGVKLDFYMRQLWDSKGSAIIEGMKPRELAANAEICGHTLARAHARSGDAVTIGAYLGKSDAMDQALADFAELYADRNELDYAELTAAVRTGRVNGQTGL
jgi:Uncharacterized protein conserved in bacteria (DUF2252)